MWLWPCPGSPQTRTPATNLHSPAQNQGDPGHRADPPQYPKPQRFQPGLYPLFRESLQAKAMRREFLGDPPVQGYRSRPSHNLLQSRRFLQKPQQRKPQRALFRQFADFLRHFQSAGNQGSAGTEVEAPVFYECCSRTMRIQKEGRHIWKLAIS